MLVIPRLRRQRGAPYRECLDCGDHIPIPRELAQPSGKFKRILAAVPPPAKAKEADMDLLEELVGERPRSFGAFPKKEKP